MVQLTVLFTLLLASPMLCAPQNSFWLNSDTDTEIDPVIPPQITRPRPTPPDNSATATPPPPQIFHSAPKGCSCSFTRQFNPVCGSDGNTYSNISLLNCYVDCGATNATVKYQGSCRRNG